MRNIAPSISELRLQRHHRWMLLWLQWCAAFLREARLFAPLTAEVEAIAHRWLDGIESCLIRLVAIAAAPRMRFCTVGGDGVRRHKQTPLFRAVIGGRLRRALRPRDLAARIAALAQPLATLVARVLKRLPCGLTRRAPIVARPGPPPPAPARVGAAEACAADTS